MAKIKTNIFLIGMPGSGKSTTGVILAKALGKQFIDTDILIQNDQQRTLQDIVDNDGHMALREIEENSLLKVNCKNHIIATGGSAAYSHAAMVHLKKAGFAVFLHADLDALKSRIHNYETRGLAKRPDQSFQDLFDERSELYNRYADITVKSSLLTQDQVCDEIITTLHHSSFRQLNSRLQKEFDTIEVMIKLYCRDHHDGKDMICDECSELLEYARKRLFNCPFHDQKASCGKCSVHCYKKDMRLKIVDVMRYSGPKMIWKHPVMAMQHLIDSRKKSPELINENLVKSKNLDGKIR